MWKKLTSKIIHKNPWTEYKHDTFEFPNGEAGNYYYMEKTPSVGIVAVDEDGKIILVQGYRYLFDEQVTELPAGGCEHGQTPEQAAYKELQEETGYTAGSMLHLGSFRASNGLIKAQEEIFLATDLTSGKQELEIGEKDFRVIKLTLEEVNELIDDNKIKDSFSIIGIKKYENYLKQNSKK